MRNKLETYIKQRRPELDVDQPDIKEIWHRIDKQTKGSGKYRKVRYWMAAAGVVLLLGAGYLMGYQFKNKKSIQTMTGLKINSQEFSTQQHVFLHVINQKWEQIEHYEFELSDYPWIKRELDLLDEIQEDYLQDLKTMGDRPEVIRALLRYYENKIRILEQFINDLEKSNKNQNRRFNHEYNI